MTTRTEETRATTTRSESDRAGTKYSKLADILGNLIKDINGDQIWVRGTDTIIGGTVRTETR